MTAMNWPFKEEPTRYGFDALVKDKSGKQAVVDVAPVRKLPRPVTLAEIKADAGFKTFPLVRISRLSVMPVSDAEWRRVEQLASKPATGASRG